MSSVLALTLVLGLALLLGLVLLLYRKLHALSAPREQDANFVILLQQQIQDLNKTVDYKMSEAYKAMHETREHLHKTLQDQFGQNTQFIQNIAGQSNRMIAAITEKLANLDRTNQQVISFSEQLNNLERILTHQKQRGNLGEAGLKLVLENILPPGSFTLQYQFPDGDTVDAAISTKDGLICVDAKFSLDNYDRLINEADEEKRHEYTREFTKDIKRRIDETAKYIKPKYGTLEFAFMFIPAEAIYYDLLINDVGVVNARNLVEYAFISKRVIIVSPTTFTAYLHTVLQGLQALKIEEGAKEIRKNVEMLQKHLTAYNDYMQKLGNTLGTTVGHFNNAYKEFGKIDKDIVKITDGERSIEVLELEKPRTEETI